MFHSAQLEYLRTGSFSTEGGILTEEEMEMSRLNFFFLKRELSKMECFFFECVNTQSILAGSLSFMLKIREEKEYCFLGDFWGIWE
jgi:hypothetical protein